jgi:hypothetical protein
MYNVQVERGGLRKKDFSVLQAPVPTIMKVEDYRCGQSLSQQTFEQRSVGRIISDEAIVIINSLHKYTTLLADTTCRRFRGSMHVNCTINDRACIRRSMNKDTTMRFESWQEAYFLLGNWITRRLYVSSYITKVARCMGLLKNTRSIRSDKIVFIVFWWYEYRCIP